MPVYRGYHEVEDNDVRSRVAIHPPRPDQPILRQYWFFVSPIPENYPLNEAKRSAASIRFLRKQLCYGGAAVRHLWR